MHDIALQTMDLPVRIYAVAVCVPGVIILFILAYVIVKEWWKRLK